MEEELHSYKNNFNTLRMSQMLIRFLSCVGIFAVTIFFTPNFNLSSFPILILSALAILIIDYFMAIITGIHDIPVGRGLVGFTSAAIVIYGSQFLINGYFISISSSLIAAAIYGIIDAMLTNRNKK